MGPAAINACRWSHPLFGSVGFSVLLVAGLILICLGLRLKLRRVSAGQRFAKEVAYPGLRPV